MTDIDWGLWNVIAEARLCDFAALLAGLNPDELNVRPAPRGNFMGTVVDLPGDAPDAAVATYRRTVRLAASAMRASELEGLSILNVDYPDGTRLRRRDFLAWARSVQLSIPSPLRVSDAAEVAGGSASEDEWIHGWDRICAALATRLRRATVSERTAREWFAKAGVKHERIGNRVKVRGADLGRVQPVSTL